MVRTLKRLLTLRNFVAVVVTTTVLVLAVAAPDAALAAAGGQGRGGHVGGHSSFGGHSGGHPGFVGDPSHRGFVGHPRFFRGHRGFVVVAPGFGFYPAYPYYYDAAPYTDYWYYCPSAGAYYPNVATCPEPWVPVPAG